MEASEVPWEEPVIRRDDNKWQLRCKFCEFETEVLRFLGQVKGECIRHADAEHKMPGTGLYGDAEAQEVNRRARAAHRAVVGTSEEVAALNDYERQFGL